MVESSPPGDAAPELRASGWNRPLTVPKSILSVAILVLLIAIVAALILAPGPGQAQRGAVAKLEALGAALEFDDYRRVTSLRIPPGCSLSALGHVSALPQLKTLTLPVTEASNQDLVPLAGAKSPENLILSGNPGITDEGLRPLSQLVNLKSLYLTDVPIQGPGLETIGELPSLEMLNLAYTKIHDDDLVHLKNLSSLKILDISYTDCSDAGLEHLRGLNRLEMVWVIAAKVTPEGGKELQKSLPNVSVRFGL